MIIPPVFDSGLDEERERFHVDLYEARAQPLLAELWFLHSQPITSTSGDTTQAALALIVAF